jgi:hypothetical protein
MSYPQQHGQQQYPPPYSQAPPQQQPAPRRRRKWPWIVVAVVLLFMVIGIANGGRGSNQPATIGGATVPPTAAPAAAESGAPPAAQAAPEPPPAPIVHEGKGDDVVTLDKPAGVAVLDFECSRCSGNVVLKTDGQGMDTLLVNTIGSYKGRHVIDSSDTARTSTLTITAKGSWKVTVTPGLSALRTSGGEPISGKGDDAVLINAATTKAAITNRGDANFVVMVLGQYVSDLAVNEIGSYEGTVPLSGPAVVEVTSSGDWSITPS